MSKLQDMIARQHRALIRQYLEPSGSTAWIAVPNADWFEWRAKTLDRRGDNLKRLETLAGVPSTQALVYFDRAGDPELWVRPEIKGTAGSGHYLTDWNKFARNYCQVDYAKADTSVLNVDHLYPETAAYRQGLKYVRVMPVDEGANKRVGRTQEKLMAQAAQEAVERQQTDPAIVPRMRPHSATPVTLAKASAFSDSIVLPKHRGDPVDFGVISRLVRHLQDMGWLENDQLTQELTTHLTRWTVTRRQGGDADQLGVFEDADKPESE